MAAKAVDNTGNPGHTPAAMLDGVRRHLDSL
jgi:hypothetical protein